MHTARYGIRNGYPGHNRKMYKTAWRWALLRGDEINGEVCVFDEEVQDDEYVARANARRRAAGQGDEEAFRD